MTFTEAAAQVLRLVGKPLHYKEITDVAIEKNLLSHVGKSPEVTMGARLAALVKKNEKENPLVRVKPGVFALRDWDQTTIDAGLADRTPALERIASLDVDDGDGTVPASVTPGALPMGSPLRLAEDEEAPLPDADERRRAEFAASATAIFATEDDDDDPIFGPEPTVSEEEPKEGHRRRRRRRRGRSPELETSSDLPSYTVSDAPEALPPEIVQLAEARESGGHRDDAPERRESFERPLERDARGPREDRDAFREGGPSPRESRGQNDRPPRDRPPVDPTLELSGRPFVDALEEILSACDPKRGPVTFQWLAETFHRRGWANGENRVQPGYIGAALRVDELRSLAEGTRSRFRAAGGRVGLTQWSLDPQLGRAERELTGALERYRDAVSKTLLRSLQDLPHRAIGEIVSLVLERLGFVGLTPVKRHGVHAAELHLAGSIRQGSGDIPTAIVVRRDGREVGRERVTELRGALHHYNRAATGWLITTGQVLSGAREEAGTPSAAPVTLIDGSALARLCQEHSIGVLNRMVRIPVPDTHFFENLRTN